MLSQKTDQELVKSYIKGSEASLGVLIERHKSQVFAFLLSKLKNRAIAEDIFQDTFVKVIKTIKSGKYNEEGKFLPWVMRIAHNLMIDHFRKNQKMQMVRSGRVGKNGDEDVDILDSIQENSRLADAEMSLGQVKGELKRLIRLLPEDQKEVLLMRHNYDMSFKEIAEMTNVSINTALGRMRYALINLRKMVEEKNINLSI